MVTDYAIAMVFKKQISVILFFPMFRLCYDLFDPIFRHKWLKYVSFQRNVALLMRFCYLPIS